MPVSFRTDAHDLLTPRDVEGIRALFDREYLDSYGPWTPDAPYGYAAAAVHVMASADGRLLGHVGFQPRVIGVGDEDICVAGTGGVLIRDTARGTGLGRRILRHAHGAMRADATIRFGYLGCRPEVVPFYKSAGWPRVRATERHTSRLDPTTTVESSGSPILIRPVADETASWPSGVIDLRGGAW